MTTNLSVWTEAGYELLAHEGPEHIQIERLAGITNLRSSDFYDHFRDLAGFHSELLKLYMQKADAYLEGIKRAKTIDPDFLRLMIEHKVTVMFHVQLTQVKDPVFHALTEGIHRQQDVLIRQLWSNFLGSENDPSLALQYFNVIRDIFYGRVTFENFTYAFLQNLAEEAKFAIKQLIERNSEEESLR